MFYKKPLCCIWNTWNHLEIIPFYGRKIIQLSEIFFFLHRPMVALTLPIALLWPGEYDENSCFRRDWTCGMFLFEPDWTVKFLLRFWFCIIVRLCVCVHEVQSLHSNMFFRWSLPICLWCINVYYIYTYIHIWIYIYIIYLSLYI